MMSVLEIEKAVSQLPLDDLSRFAEWFTTYQQSHNSDTTLNSLFKDGASYPVWSPHGSFAAAEAMMQALALDKESRD